MFQGFDDKTVDFMWGIRFNNERSWFSDHKQEFIDHFQTPMRELSAELFDHISKKLPDYPLESKVSRIYKDARRLHGQGPYRDHLWISAEQPTDEEYAATMTFWFELGPEEWSYGLGYYRVRPVTMAKLRARMDADPAPMEKLTRKLTRQREFHLEGQEYKKPRAEAPSAILKPWYLKKNFSLIHEEKLTDELFSRGIAERILKGYDFLIPYYEYFITLDGDPDPRVN